MSKVGYNGCSQLDMDRISAEQLLDRREIQLDLEFVRSFLKDKTVLVTGGGGSIGSELCRQIAECGVRRLIIFDIYENGAYYVHNELTSTHPELDVVTLIGSIRDEARVESVISQYRPDVIYHAAAHKHVPLMEQNPCEAVKNNVFGTLNVVRAADKYGVGRFIMISTDKSVNPTSVMGATKRICEMIIQSYARTSKTEFAAVRFGNVLDSSGSVVPLFRHQIAEGGPVRVTHPEVSRYFMTIPEAVALVLEAGVHARGGEIFVLDMGEPVKIVTLAERLIRLSGYEPYKDIMIEFTGLRPGEKLYEELLIKSETLDKTSHDMIFIEKDEPLTLGELEEKLEHLSRAVATGEDAAVREALHKVVPTFRTPTEINADAAKADEMREARETVETVSV